MKLGSIISGIGTLGSAIGSTIGTIISRDKTNKSNEKINKKNLDFAREQFQYQKYLNNNQFQIQSADAQKAGINPLAMTAGSLNGGSYSNASHPVESVYNGELGSLIAQFANIANQKQMNKESNDTSKEIATLNANNSKDIAILKILSDEKIASNLNQNQKEMLLAELSSKEKISEANLGETIRHNKASENIQDKIASAQEVLNSATATHYKKMDYINDVNSAVENYIKESKNNYLKEQLKIQQGFLREAIRDNNTKRAKVIIDGINDLLSTAVSAINPLSGVFSSGSSNKIGF